MFSICFVHSHTGEVVPYAENVDLDYYNIRNWRKVYFALCELNAKEKDTYFYYRLVIEPIKDSPF